jgi:hypothetical protein
MAAYPIGDPDLRRFYFYPILLILRLQPCRPFPRYEAMMMLPHLRFGETILPVVADYLRCFLRYRRG